VLYRVEQTGPACHTGAPTCFAQLISGPAEQPGRRAAEQHPAGDQILSRLAATIRQRASANPAESYTARLLSSGLSKVSQKVGEEAVEVVVAAHAEDDGRLVSEAADLLYHLLVLLESRGIPLDAVWRELENRGLKHER
jgi:phosphoribosyl-AMP cyclohydrolase / phosphoribosyl-ATP pyrophosphohydrolase